MLRLPEASVSPRRLPSWVYGLPHMVAGSGSAFVFVAIPLLLVARGVSVEHVAWVTAIAGSPISWAFLLCPLLDVQWSRRTYQLALTLAAAVCFGASVLMLAHVNVLTAVLTVGETAAWMSAYCCYGWKSEFLDAEQVPAVCGWSETWGQFGGGVFAGLAVLMTRTLGAAASLGITVMLLLPGGAALLFPRRSSRARGPEEVFSSFFHDMARILKQRRCRYALLIFLVPDAAFAFAFSAVGADFHMSEHAVSLVTGPLAGAASAAGCLLAIPLCRRIPAQLAYIGPGVVAGLIALSMMALPRNQTSFGVGCLLYMMMLGINFASFFTFAMRIAGKANPLVASLLALMGGVSNLSIVAMKALDGRAYTLRGLSGMLAVDGGVTVACGAMVIAFLYMRSAVGHEPELEPVAAEGAA